MRERPAAVQQFAKELTRLYQAARKPSGRPPSGRQVAHQAAKEKIKIGPSSLSAWLRGMSVPRSARTLHFLVAYLGSKTEGGYSPLGSVAWERLRVQAWEASHTNRGGRPPKQGMWPPVGAYVPPEDVDVDGEGGVINLNGDVNLLSGMPVETRYRQQVRRIAPQRLIDRDTELTELATFCTSPSSAGAYAWWRAEAWSGKSALMSWFVLHPPAGVRIVSFFVTARLASQNDRAAFIDNLMEQLLDLLGRRRPFLTEPNREAHLLGLLHDAAVACRARGEQFVLVVDGLDEDRGVHAGIDWHSIAELLPAQLPAGMRVIVASRPDPPIPVTDDHPLHPHRAEAIVRTLVPSRHARARRVEMERDLERLLQGCPAEQDLLGLVAAGGSGLSASDLAELTESSQWDVEKRLRAVTGRSFSRRGSHYQPGNAPDVYLLGHEELQLLALEMLGSTRVEGYREKLHTWAERYRARRWPPGTPEYLLHGYYNMLVAAGDLPRMVSCATDLDRQERMFDLSGGDRAALAEIITAQDIIAAQSQVNLAALVRLAMCRDTLADRRDNIPTNLAALWAAVGHANRAEAFALSITDAEKQASALGSVATVLARIGERGRVAELVTRATGLLGQDDWHKIVKARILSAVAGAVTSKDDLVAKLAGQAERVARSIGECKYQNRTLCVLAASLANTSEHDRAVRLANEAERRILSVGKPDWWEARDLASALAGVGRHSEAETLAWEIDGPYHQVEALTALVRAIAASDNFSYAEELARSIAYPASRATALSAVAEVLAAAGNHGGAMELANEAETTTRLLTDLDELEQANAFMEGLVAVAMAFAACGDNARATSLAYEVESTARSITDARGWSLTALSGALSAIGRVDLGEELARSMFSNDEPYRMIDALSAVAAAAADVDHERAVKLATEAARLTSAATTRINGSVLSGVTKALAAVGHVRDAENLAVSITDPFGQSEALCAVAEALARAGEVRAATLARSILPVTERAIALNTIAAIWVRKCSEAYLLACEGETLARSIQDGFEHARALIAVVRFAVASGDTEATVRLTDEVEALASTATGFCTILDDITDQSAEIFSKLAKELELDHGRSLVARALQKGRWAISLESLAHIDPSAVTAAANYYSEFSHVAGVGSATRR